jgi:predicted RNA binding protein YcfA (HicA-like mRNA interferase family)
VSRLKKLKRKLSEAPGAIRFDELVRVLRDMGYSEARSRGSHHVFRPEGPGPSILIVKPHAGRAFCAEVDVRRVLALLEQQEASHEEE